MRPLLLALTLAAATPAPPAPAVSGPTERRIEEDLDQAEAALRSGRAREALDQAEATLALPLPEAARARALGIASAAAAMLDDPIRARYYRLLARAGPEIPPELIRDQAEERYRDLVASAEPLVLSPLPGRRGQVLRLLLAEAKLALGEYAAAVAYARTAGPEESGELLLECARRMLDAGDAAGALDAAATAEPAPPPAPVVDPDDPDSDDQDYDPLGFQDARLLLLGRAALALGDAGQALEASAELLAIADQASERDAALALADAARGLLDAGAAHGCRRLEPQPGP